MNYYLFYLESIIDGWQAISGADDVMLIDDGRCKGRYRLLFENGLDGKVLQFIKDMGISHPYTIDEDKFRAERKRYELVEV